MSFLVYALLRVLLIVGAGVVLYLLGMRGLLLGVLAVAVGAMLSYVLFSGARRRAIEDMQRFAQSEPKTARPDADSLAEDADLDGAEPDAEPRAAVSAEPEGQQQRDPEK